MAGLAQITSVDVRCALAQGTAAIVTAQTGLATEGAVVKDGTDKGGGVMAHFARLGGRNVGRTLADGDHVVVTAFASPHHFVVIDTRGRHKGCRRVTSLTGIAGIDVGVRFSNGRRAIMTT